MEMMNWKEIGIQNHTGLHMSLGIYLEALAFVLQS